TADLPLAAVLLHQREADRLAAALRERFGETHRTLHPARVGRQCDDALSGRKPPGEVIDEQVDGFDVHLTAPERVLERREIVHVRGDDRVRAGGLEERRDVSRRDGIAGLGSAILARVREIRHERDDAARARILQRTDEDEQTKQLVARACLAIGEERLTDDDPLAGYAFERTNLELRILELAL